MFSRVRVLSAPSCPSLPGFLFAGAWKWGVDVKLDRVVSGGSQCLPHFSGCDFPSEPFAKRQTRVLGLHTFPTWDHVILLLKKSHPSDHSKEDKEKKRGGEREKLEAEGTADCA